MGSNPPQSPEPSPRRGWDRRRTIGAAVGAAVVLGILALLLVGLMNRDVGTSIRDALDEGERPDAPAFELEVLAAGDGLGPVGSRVSLADLRGKVVVLNFWASWCPPCKDEAPIFESVAARYRGREDVVVLGIDSQDLREAALGFIEGYGLTYPSLRDGEDATSRAYEVAAFPETFIIDPQGRIALKLTGQVVESAQLTTPISQLL